MRLKRPMCIVCKRLYADVKYGNGHIGICGRCAKKLPETGLNFAALHSAKYVISPFYYKDGIRTSMLEYKFNSCYRYSEVFAAAIYKRISNLLHLRDFDMLISVPISEKRMTERGYNQSALIAEPIAKSLGVDFNDTVLIRSRHTRQQSGLDNAQRAENVRNAFSVTEDIADKRIIVFDDIYTSGCTLCECARELIKAGAREVAGMTAAIVERTEISSEAALIL